MIFGTGHKLTILDESDTNTAQRTPQSSSPLNHGEVFLQRSFHHGMQLSPKSIPALRSLCESASEYLIPISKSEKLDYTEDGISDAPSISYRILSLRQNKFISTRRPFIFAAVIRYPMRSSRMNNLPCPRFKWVNTFIFN